MGSLVFLWAFIKAQRVALGWLNIAHPKDASTLDLRVYIIAPDHPKLSPRIVTEFSCRNRERMPALHNRLFGDFQISAQGKPLNGFEPPCLCSLLAYLLLHRNVP